MGFLRTIYRLLLRITPIILAIVGWRIARWPGLLGGAVVGVVVSISVWLILHVVFFRRRLNSRRGAMAGLPNERLREIAVDPTHPEMAFAIGELSRRGIEVRPTLESLCAMLTSPQPNRRALGMSLIFGIYPAVHARIPMGASSADSAEVWRARLAELHIPS